MVVAKLFLLVIFTNLFIAINPAQAYLDPGTGSFIVQSIIATVFAVGMCLDSHGGCLGVLHNVQQQLAHRLKEKDADGVAPRFEFSVKV